MIWGTMRQRDFERLYADHAQPLFGFLSYRTGDRALAEDLLADTFANAYRARARFDRRKASDKTCLYSIALNLVRDHQRRRAAERRALETVGARSGGDGSMGFGPIEDRDALTRALSALSPEERDAVALRFGADLTVPEIAKLTRHPLTTIEGRVYRALRKLRDELD